MKIKITEIEANAEELKASQTLASSFSNLLRNAFAVQTYRPSISETEEDEEGEEEQESEE